MIRSSEEHLQAHQALRELEEGLAALRLRLGTSHPALFSAMAQDYFASITAIRQDIDDYVGLGEVQSTRAPLWFGLEGGALGPENIRTSLLAGWLERLRKAVVAVAGFEVAGQALRGRPEQTLLEGCDFRLIGFRPGSLKIGLEMPEPDQLTLFPEGADESAEAAKRALTLLLEKAAVASELRTSRRQPTLRPQALSPVDLHVFRQVLRVTPGRKERVRAVVLEGALVPRPKPVRLDADVRAHLAATLAGEEPTSIEEIHGTIREIDLDRRHIILRERPEGLPDTTVYFNSDLSEEAAGALDRRVRVEASRRGPTGRLRALTIEPLEDAPL